MPGLGQGGSSRGAGKARAGATLAWMSQKPFITAPIVGASKPHHIDDAVAALSLNLTPEEIAALE